MSATSQQPPKIKICGIFREEDVSVLNETLPDYAGFVFAEKSHRYVTPEQACVLRSIIDPRIITVGVFVDADPGFIAELARKGTIGAVQLHGHEDAAYVDTLRKKLPDTTILKAVSISNTDNTKGSVPLVSPGCSVDILLFDNGAGGTGETFDHRVIRDAAANGALPDTPFFLAGGLDAENITEVLAQMRDLAAFAASTRFFGVDVSSGVETNRVKDSGKIKKFVKAVRQAE
ncbi:N-(5'-phosphoribosyl)anthranilate isomerase [Clostridia bacterium]|nr:N-(5'-phosphoribosyl)anthranilate isomerase [Clostridia bacterium]